jgi:hypothetical protein
MRMKTAGYAALLACPLLLAAQSGAGGANFGMAGIEGLNGAGHGENTVLNFQDMPLNACSMALRAQHLADGTMLKTARDHVQGPGQRLHLILTRPDARKITSVTVKVSGWAPTGRVQQAAQADKDAGAQAGKQLVVAMQAESDTTAVGDLWAPGLTAVTSIELVSIGYTDGSKWAPAAGQSCRVEPDGIMPVAGR